MAMEIQLISHIEKHEFLYNFNLPEYNRKDLIDEAWTKIAANSNLSVTDCKEKWRNIRSSFLRSMKPSRSKTKKPYYLCQYLKFILPFLKPVQTDNTEDDNNETQTNSQTEIEIVNDFEIKQEPEERENDPLTESNDENVCLNDILTRTYTTGRRKRRFVPAGRRNMGAELKRRGKVVPRSQRHTTTDEHTKDSAMKMFLMSLLPELETMNEEQTRLFKIKSMVLIDNIKTNSAQMKRNTDGVNAERLQKRLINLLLKNLQRICDDTTKEQ